MKQFIIAEISSAVMRTWMTTGETVTVVLYDKAGASVPLTAGTATEIGTTGVFSWSLTDITTPPTAYEDYAIVFTGSVTGARVDEFRVAGWPDTLVSHAVGATGASAVTITIEDQSTNTIPSVGVNIYDATNTTLLTSGVTNASGQIVFNLNDGSYKVRLIKNLVTFNATEDLTVAGDGSQTYTGTVLTITAPVEPNTCRVYDYAFNQAGSNPVQSIDATASIVELPFNLGGGYHIGDKITPTYTTSDGLFYWDLPYGAVVSFRVPDFGIQGQSIIPAVATKELNELTLT
jgi:hypothetical protein